MDVAISRTGDLLYWVGGLVPNMTCELIANGMRLVQKQADQSGVLFLSEDQPLPIAALVRTDLRLRIHALHGDDSVQESFSKAPRILPFAISVPTVDYVVQTDEPRQVVVGNTSPLVCSTTPTPTAVAVGVYGLVPAAQRRQLQQIASVTIGGQAWKIHSGVIGAPTVHSS
jgi:hypothetical protein